MKCLHPVPIKRDKRKLPSDKLIEMVPCGKCVNCLANKRQSWSLRLWAETLSSSTSLFLTLTYEETKMPLKGNNPTLLKRDLQLFFKRLRKYIHSKYPDSPKIKYFSCGEYGGLFNRPHYHAIIFSLPAVRNFFLFYEDVLRDIWGKGHITVEGVNGNRIGYVSKYLLKSDEERTFPNRESYYDVLGVQPPFLLSSNGIGASLLDRFDFNAFVANKGVVRLLSCCGGLPRYILSKLPEEVQLQIKLYRKKIERTRISLDYSRESVERTPQDLSLRQYEIDMYEHLQQQRTNKIL